MKRDDDPTIVSLETHRRQRLAAKRKKPPARPSSPHERAINWRRVPLLLGVVVLFLLGAWLLRQAGGMINPFH